MDNGDVPTIEEVIEEMKIDVQDVDVVTPKKLKEAGLSPVNEDVLEYIEELKSQ